MKTKLSFAILAAALACGAANAQTAYTTPVGYETLSLSAGTNYTGIRLHQAPVAQGTVTAVTSGSFSDSAVNLQSLLVGGATTFYIVEFLNASGVFQEVTGASATGSTVTLVDDVTSKVSIGDKYLIRPADTLASIFGADNAAGLTPGFFGPAGADIISVPDGAGGFDEYYYDEDQASWAIVNESGGGDPVVASQVPLIYYDGIVASVVAPLSLIVTGEVKSDSISSMLPVGTNYLGSIFPAGATLESSFGAPATIASLDPGFFGPSGADIFQIPDGLGGFDQYYYDEDQGSWAQVNESGGGDPIDASEVDMSAGFGFINVGSPIDLLQSPPASYSNF